jgi:tetratricopeptide (TPR) repeat protein
MKRLLLATILAAALLEPHDVKSDAINGAISASTQEAKLTDAFSLHQHAQQLVRQGEREQALAEINRAIVANPYYTQAYLLRGQLHAEAKEFERAVADLDKAIEQDDSFVAAYHQRARSHQQRRDYRQALADFDKALKLEPANALILRDRALAHRDAGDYDQAVDDYQEALRIGFSAIDPAPLAHLLFFQGRFSQSAQILNQLVRSQPQDRYMLLWRYLATAKANGVQTAGRELSEQANRLTDKQWPAPLIDYLLDRLDESALHGTLNGDESSNSTYRCEINFYAGQAKLLKGANDAGFTLLQSARSQCTPSSPFFHGARADLRRYGQ